MLLNILKSRSALEDMKEIKKLKERLTTSKNGLENLQYRLIENEKNISILNEKITQIKSDNKFLSDQLIKLKDKGENLTYDEEQIFEDIKYFIHILIAKERESKISQRIKNIFDEKEQIIKEINNELGNLNNKINGELGSLNNKTNEELSSLTKGVNFVFFSPDTKLDLPSYINHSFVKTLASFGLIKLITSTTVKFLENKLNDIDNQVKELKLNIKNIKDELILSSRQIENEETIFKYLCQEKINIDNNLKINMVSIELYKVLFDLLKFDSLNALKLHLDNIFKMEPILSNNLKLKNLYMNICEEIN